MQRAIKIVLEKIEEQGFEAYLVGGYVRDYLLGIKSTDIDICTNALPKDLVRIFEGYKGVDNGYGSFKIVTDKYNFDITTYRYEADYVGHKPQTVEYVNSLLVDIKRRDFTINALCMNSKGQVFDFVEGKKDLKNYTLKMIGNAKERLSEDPLRILRAIRFAAILGFDLDGELEEAIYATYTLVSVLSKERIKSELDKMLACSNALRALSLLKKFRLDEIIGISYTEVNYVSDLLGIYSQMTLSDDYFNKTEKEHITAIKEILSRGIIDNRVLYDYGLYPTIVAAKIMKESVRHVNKLYSKIPIKSKKDLDIEVLEICNIIGISPGKDLKVVLDHLVDVILDGQLENNRKSITKYLINIREEWFNE